MKEYIIAFECPATESSERIACQVQQKLVGELIRCKDCKYYRIYKHPDWTVELCGRFRTTMADPVKEDDYCSKAERKEE